MILLPVTYEPIASTTLGSSQATITFDNISGTFTDLVIVCNTIGSTDIQILMRFNNLSTNIYSTTQLGGNGTSASSARGANQDSIALDYFFSVTTGVGNNIVNVMNYANTTTNKTVLVRSNNAAKGLNANVGLWRSTSAITRIDLLTSTGTFSSGSTFSLYGIKSF